MYEAIDDDGRVVTLRKPRNCEWCGQQIAVGEKAVHRTYRWDGDFNNARQHPECFAAMKAYFAHTDWSEDGFEAGVMVRGEARHKSEKALREATTNSDSVSSKLVDGEGDR